MKSYAPDELIGPLNEVERRYAPEQVHAVGNTSLLGSQPRVSIIGTRRPSERGRRTAEQLAAYLVSHNVTVVSGLAAGIDTIAHRTAINSGGSTIAVLGTPPDTAYPRDNQKLQEDIGQNHLLLSQFSPGSTIQRRNFPMRNRTMALFSHATVIVEAGKSSGTQHQGWEALRLGRPLFIMADLLDDTSLRWPQKMAEYGAQRLSTSDLSVVHESLPNPLPVSGDGFALTP